MSARSLCAVPTRLDADHVRPMFQHAGHVYLLRGCDRHVRLFFPHMEVSGMILVSSLTDSCTVVLSVELLITLSLHIAFEKSLVEIDL